MHNITHMQYIQAIQSLRPNVGFSIDGEDYSSLKFSDDNIVKPTEEEIQNVLDDIVSTFNNAEYQRLRANEYPPITDYIDGVVKGSQSQIDAYIAACQAVKLKYPKPE